MKKIFDGEVKCNLDNLDLATITYGQSSFLFNLGLLNYQDNRFSKSNEKSFNLKIVDAPSSKRIIKFRFKHNSCKFYIQFPTIKFLLFGNKDLYAYVLDPKQELKSMPLPNINVSGKCCLPGIIKNFTSIEDAIDCFWLSEFNNDLLPNVYSFASLNNINMITHDDFFNYFNFLEKNTDYLYSSSNSSRIQKIINCALNSEVWQF